MKKNRIAVLATVVFLSCFSKSLMAQFTFGLKSGLILSQVEGDNMVGFKKAGYDIGLTGGYELNENHDIIIELSFSQSGSNRRSEAIPQNINRSLWEIDLKTINIFTAYAFKFGDNWDGTKDYRFTGGFKFNKILDSEINIYNRRSVTNEVKSLNSSFISLRVGPGVHISDHFALDFFYEHTIGNIAKSNSETASRSLNPYAISFVLSYYF